MEDLTVDSLWVYLLTGWDWLIAQLGWTGDLSWTKIVFIGLAVLGAISLLRRLSGSKIGYPVGRGSSLDLYLPNKRLGDFRVNPDIYKFGSPVSTKFNWELARKLFIGGKK